MKITETAAGTLLSPSPCSTSAVFTGSDGRTYLKFQPHGYEYPIALPVITTGTRDGTGCWTWNGSLEKPTLRPSIKTTHGGSGLVSHLWLHDGICEHLGDSTDGLAGQTLPLVSLENDKITRARDGARDEGGAS